MSEQICTIVIKVDLGCEKCYNKIRQVLCKFHCQIRSKTFDEKNNIVIVTGWFHPCEFSKKLRCKAGKAIISIEIMKKKEPEKPPPKQPDPPPPPPVQPPPKEPDLPPPPPIQPPPKQPDPPPPPPVKPPPEPEPEPQKIIIPYFVPGYPTWYEGYGGAPCYEGYGRPVVPVPPPYQFPSKPPICPEPTPPPCRCGCYYGRPPPCSCGCGGYRRCSTPCSCGCGGYRRCATPCSCGCGGYRRCATPWDYFNEENSNSCSIM